MERVFAADGDHFLGKWAHCACFGEGGFDAAVFDQADDLICQQRVTMGLRAAKFDGFLFVAHEKLKKG